MLELVRRLCHFRKVTYDKAACGTIKVRSGKVNVPEDSYNPYTQPIPLVTTLAMSVLDIPLNMSPETVKHHEVMVK